MKSVKIKTSGREETIALGEKIAKSLSMGKGVLMTGDLGTGKTTITMGLCRGLGASDPVRSPTFTLVREYRGTCPIHHIDLYRLDDYDELENIGWEEMSGDSCIYIVEWADRFELPFTENSLEILIEYGRDFDLRTITVNFDENIFPNLEKDLKEYADTGN